jgi:excisionase family DNA binding protein
MVANQETRDDALMTIREAADYLRCSRATVFRFLQRGQLIGFKVGQKTVVYARDVKQLVRAREPTQK